MAHTSEKRFPVSSKDYKLYEEVGDGVSATVYRALCVPLNETVAIKVLDLEKCNNDLDGIRKEVQTMILIDHPNLLRAHCSFPTDRSLWVVMPYMAGGSCLHIMKSAYPDGFEELVIATLLREVLKALVYLHSHGHIHRDVKAGNILVDYNGAVKLADFGVSACMFDTGDRQRSRNTFVGTPCWMAPEVMQQLHGYDFKADIWSFGITALELAHGHAPFSKYPPMKVLLMTLQNAPPGLDYERDRRFSKSFKEMVAACLVKDPKKRPTSEKLLKHPFFKHARANDYLARAILRDLSPLGDRFRALKAKESDFLLQNKGAYEEHLSQQEYIRGISAWNFNLEDLKAQAALIQDDNGISNFEESDMDSRPKHGNAVVDIVPQELSPERDNHVNRTTGHEDGPCDLPVAKGSLASSFPLRPLQALKGCFDICEDDVNATSPNWKDVNPSDSEHLFEQKQSSAAEGQGTGKDNDENLRSSRLSHRNFTAISGQNQRFLSGPLSPDDGLSSAKKVAGEGDRESAQQKYPTERNYSGPLPYRPKRDLNNNHVAEDASDGAVIQRKGRFKVTSADANSKGGSSTNCFGNCVSGTQNNSTTMANILLPTLQHILQQNGLQRDLLIKLIKSLEQTSGSSDLMQFLQFLPPSSREKELESQVFHLEQSVGGIDEELQLLRMKNAQIERELSALLNKER